MKLTAPLLGLSLLIFITGCDTMTYSHYTGQVKAWPTGSAFSDKVFAVPVYRGWPEKAYDVIGFIEFTNPNVDWNDGDMKQASVKAKAAGGDAMLIVPRNEATSPTLAKVREDVGAPGDRTIALVLKWK
jgi:hypothetical protein